MPQPKKQVTGAVEIKIWVKYKPHAKSPKSQKSELRPEKLVVTIPTQLKQELQLLQNKTVYTQNLYSKCCRTQHEDTEAEKSTPLMTTKTSRTGRELLHDK